MSYGELIEDTDSFGSKVLTMDICQSFSLWEWNKGDGKITVCVDTTGASVDVELNQLPSMIKYLKAVCEKHGVKYV